MKRGLALIGLAFLVAGCDAGPSDADNGQIATEADNAAVAFKPNALDNQMSEAAERGQQDLNATAAARKVPGAECLSLWDGSAVEFVEQVKAGLRDPDSFEHIETTIGLPTSTGLRPITMRYRSKNGFGGMVENEVPAALDPRDCKVTLITSRRQVTNLLGR